MEFKKGDLVRDRQHVLFVGNITDFDEDGEPIAYIKWSNGVEECIDLVDIELVNPPWIRKS